MIAPGSREGESDVICPNALALWPGVTGEWVQAGSTATMASKAAFLISTAAGGRGGGEIGPGRSGFAGP